MARRLKARIDDGMDTFDAFNACQDHLVAVGRAHVERVVYEDLAEAAGKAPSSIGDHVESLRNVFALSRIEADRAWYLESGFMEPGKTTAIRALLTALCGELRPAMGALVEGFAIPDAMVQAPIAFGIDPRRPPTA